AESRWTMMSLHAALYLLLCWADRCCFMSATRWILKAFWAAVADYLLHRLQAANWLH
ncbi:hypothetical protein Dimus_022618, partial [Dionaea muscipula]